MLPPYRERCQCRVRAKSALTLGTCRAVIGFGLCAAIVMMDMIISRRHCLVVPVVFVPITHIVNCLPAAIASSGIWITPNQQLQALQALARGYRRTLTATRVIAITGSVGKTTTRELLRSMLQQQHRVTASHANHNNELGVALTILRIKSDDHYAIVECGARQHGDLTLLADITVPDIVLITNVGSAHVGMFGSPAQLLHGKLELLQHSPRHCLGIINADCPKLLAAAQRLGRKLVSFGTAAVADVRITNVSDTGQQQRVQLEHAGQGKFTLSRNDPHRALPLNLAAAASVCLTLDLSIADMQAGSDTYRNAPSRFQTISRGNLTIIDDSYNASPESMRCGLASLQHGWPQQRHVLILGDMTELGADAVDVHRQLGQLVQDMRPALLITVGKLARHIAAAAPQLLSMSFDDVDAFLQQKISLTQYGDLVYLKASRKVDLTRIVATLS